MIRQRRKREKLTVARTSDSFKASIDLILERHKRYYDLIRFLGDYGERAFRYWLIAECLTTVLGWTADKIVAGEVFDILLLNRHHWPVITIETKAPGKVFSKGDRQSFQARLNAFPSLEFAVLTNGRMWFLRECKCIEGKLELGKSYEWNVGRDNLSQLAKILRSDG